MTNPARELEELRRWTLRPGFAHGKIFTALVQKEFSAPEEQAAQENRALAASIRQAFAAVPYYRDLAARLGLRPEDIVNRADLPRLPPLTKNGVQDNKAALKAEALPKGERIVGVATSSGTTGRPTQIPMTLAAVRMFGFLKQREYRWYRFDPKAKLATIRLASQIPSASDEKSLGPGETRRLDGWPQVSEAFVTGPFAGFAVTNPIADQIAWLEAERPHYLMSYSESLEHLALALEDRRPWGELRGLLAISEQLTQSMRRRIERTFGVPIHQNYGLNEVGLVAVRCDEGRYHVHAEHCLVEIVRDDGTPCAPGERGRILVTSLRNAAMPLLRYDTDDLAETAEGPCACGRTLPGFGNVAGRYSRIAYLPEGTLGCVGAVRAALEDMPVELCRGLRQFQMHQSRDNRFELRLVTAAPLPAEFGSRVEAAWRAAEGDKGFPLAIVTVESIARGRGGKFQDFISDFAPGPGDDE